MQIRRARFAVAATFLLHAVVLGTWAPRLPAVKEKLSLGNDDLGLALAGLAVGMVIGTRLVVRLEARGRTGGAMRIALVVQAITLLGPAFAWNLPSLVLTLVLLGIVGGALDVLMNVHAVAVERLYRRPIMSSFHGLWSVGSMLAGATAASAAAVDLELGLHFGIVSVLSVLLAPLLLAGLLPGDDEAAVSRTVGADERGQGGRSPRRTPVVGPVVVGVLALMGFGAFLSEGAIADWSAVFLHDERGVSEGFAALGFTAFSAAMAFSRLVADRIGARVGAVVMARSGGLLAAAGYLVFLLFPHPAAALLGFVVAGLGIGPCVPVVFSAAGNTGTTKRDSVLSIAVAAGYVGVVVGPSVIGWVSEHVGLGWALSAPIAFLALVVAAAGLLRNAAGGQNSPSSEADASASMVPDSGT